jgi:hypothetical protein
MATIPLELYQKASLNKKARPLTTKKELYQKALFNKKSPPVTVKKKKAPPLTAKKELYQKTLLNKKAPPLTLMSEMLFLSEYNSPTRTLKQIYLTTWQTKIFF